MSDDHSRDDPIEQILAVTRQQEDAERQRERLLGRQIVVGRAYLVSAALIVLLAAALALPHSAGVRGFDVLFYTEAAKMQETSLPSRIFVWLYSGGTIVFGVLTILTQRWWAAAVAWCASCVSAVYGVLAIWLSQSGRGPDPNFHGFGRPGIGIYASELLLVAIVVALGMVLWSRTPQQRRLERHLRGGD